MADGGRIEYDNDEESYEYEYEYDDQYSNEVDEADQRKSLVSIEEEDTGIYSSIARKPENGTIPQDILEFSYSYAYDCRKLFNLCVIDKDTLMFASGNLIHFFNVAENKIWFKRGSRYAGIGHVTKNPVFEHIAVGLNQEHPHIIIYDWPSMTILNNLKGGTTKRYLHLTYSPEGLLLASQGGEPDYFISLWHWQTSKIILQCQSHVHEVFNVTFSKYMPGQLTSSGSGHIKFWKMSKTFTGLKLKNEVGKFGKTEISDIIAIHPMPNETVISGCEWGNILLWDETLIKLEASRKNKQTAHDNYITQFEYINGELISTATDGWIRFWFYETMDLADLPSEERLLEMQPIYEFHITEGEENSKQDTMLMCIQKQEPNSPNETTWYAQDGNGGIWLLDLCTSSKEREHMKIFTCHAGPIVDMDVAVWGPFMATLDKSGKLHIYNYIENKLLVVHKFYDIGRQVIWLPCTIERTGSTLVCAFESGIIRLITVAVTTASIKNNIKQDYTRLVQVLKPHLMSITVMSLNVSCSLLVTGSADATIFTFHVESMETYPTIVPIGYVKVPSPVTCLTWNPDEEATLLIGCLLGDCVEVRLPKTPQSYTTTTYELVKCKPAAFKFESVKSLIQRETVRQKYEEEKEKRIEERRKEMEKLQIENPHVVIDEETFLADFEEEEVVLPEIYIPEIPNRITVATYSPNGNVWLLMGGFDAGFVYEYPRPLSVKMKNNKLIACRIIDAAEDTEIHNCLSYKDRKYLFMGTQNGELLVCKMNTEDPLDLSDYWILPIHDYYNGHMSKILLSYDKKMLLTCGHDGNIFSFEVNDDTPHESVNIPKADDPLPLPANVEDIEADYPSLEEVVTQNERSRVLAAAEEKKNSVLQIIRSLAEEYAILLTRNNKLLPSQRISQLELDPRIVEDLEVQVKAQITLTQEKLEFQVETSTLKLQKLMQHFIKPITCLPFAVCGIFNEEKMVHSLRELKLNVENILKHIPTEKQFEENRDAGRILADVQKKSNEAEEEETQYFEGLLADNYSDLTTSVGLQINQMLAKYKEKKMKLIERQKEWQALYAKKPNLVKSRLIDSDFIKKTETTIGEFNLKMNTGFKSKKKETAISKYTQLLNCRTKLHHLREDFNEKLRAVRSKKQDLQKEVARLTETLRRIHTEIPLKNIKPLPELPKLNFNIELPEHNLELKKYTSMSEKMELVRRRRQSLAADQPSTAFDLEYEVLLCDDKGIVDEEGGSLSTLISSSKLKIKSFLPSQNTIIRDLNINDSIETPWEREMKRLRMWRKLHEQDSILRYIENSYKSVEDELDELEEYRLEIMYQSVYMNLTMLTFYQEFMVLKESEVMENTLEDHVNKRTEERMKLTLKIQSLNVKIATREEAIRKLHVRIKELGMEYAKAINDTKFNDFLMKIYRKKQAVAREKNGSVDSITQSSDISSDETDSTGEDSETGPLLFDETICPAGCDKNLYDMAFSMRQKRHMCELQIKDEQREIESLYKELELHTKKLKVAEQKLKKDEENLEAFIEETQKKLNDIDVTVIFKMHQLQHVIDSEQDSEQFAEIEDCVVFNKQELSNLYARVGKLQDETNDLEERRKKNVNHIKRIQLDLKYMETQNKTLEEAIREKKIQKFGQQVSLIKLYETVLQRLIYSIKTDVGKIMKEFTEDINNIKRECTEQLIVLENLIRCNTEKVSLLTVLEKEKYKLKKILEKVPLSEEDMLQTEIEHMADIATLESILQSQMEQKLLLQHEIENLRTGPKKLSSSCLKENML